MARQYSDSAYDKHYCLKVSIPMGLSMLFLARPFVILVMSIANRRDRIGLLETFYHSSFALGVDTFAALPALLVLVAWARRQPNASPAIRWLWSHGRSLLLLATLLNIASVFLPFLLNTGGRMDIPEIAKLAICMVILYVLVKSERTKDTFADFPESLDKQKQSRS